ncbi:MAG: HAMP domain-containing histidine kinase [Pyrinomonadaceae bacterium]|nr:HAMP domain-containing histidine kinase [Pyrinomonadaceae bacterium]
MRISSRRRSIAFFITLGSCLVALAVALNVGWILLTPRQIALLVLGIIFFSLLIAGLVLNTIFLVREIRRNEQQDSFLNAVTHELKTPIASIRLYLETLQTREVDEARRQEFYRIMLEDNDRLLHTVEQVLRAGSAHHKGRRTDKTAIDLGQLTRECLELTATRYHLDGRALLFKETFNGDGRAIVSGDPEELRAALSNLLDNAVKYSEERVNVQVEVATLDRRRATVSVRDSGVGIPRGQLKRIFKRFYRVPMPVIKRIKGTGLGLFIVRSIVEKHGGRVFAESNGEGAGSTFTIQLPRMEEK